MILIIDNYDSFTYNLYQYVGEIYQDVVVFRNDAITLEEIEKMAPEAIIISPGPGYPKDSGISMAVIEKFSPSIPILGVCLGHQGIIEINGGKIVHAKQLMHGKMSVVTLDNESPLFENIPKKVQVGRYHSLSADEATFPESLKIIGRDDDGEIMAVAHKEYPVYGVQFHPESIITKFGRRMVRNFLTNIAGVSVMEDTERDTLEKLDKNRLKPYISKVIDSENLTEEEATKAMDFIMSDLATDAQIGSFLTALRMKGETIEEITGFAKSMRKKALKMPETHDCLDIVGTGGDMAKTFNISTTTSFIAAAAGAKVAKHGNRSVSSLSGSADVLESLGVRIDLSPEEAVKCLEEVGVCFMFAPAFHSSMRFAASPRKEIGVRSVFNILGPLSNPAAAEYMLLGVYDEELLEVMAKVLKNLGISHALVVHGEDGLDEISLSGITHICEVDDGKIIKYDVSPESLGIEAASLDEVVGGTAQENSEILLNILKGEKGPKRDIVLLNTAAALFAARIAPSLTDGIKLAEEAIDSGKALEKLEELVRVSNSI